MKVKIVYNGIDLVGVFDNDESLNYFLNGSTEYNIIEMQTNAPGKRVLPHYEVKINNDDIIYTSKNVINLIGEPDSVAVEYLYGDTYHLLIQTNDIEVAKEKAIIWRKNNI